MTSNRSAQTFALIHLVELIMGLLVLVIIGIGLVSMVSGITFLQQYFAKDNAYIVESLYGAPNGEIEYGYLWSGKDYVVNFHTTNVSVARSSSTPVKRTITSFAVTKAYSTSVGTTIEPQKPFIPQYYQFSTRGKVPRIITIVERVALQSCPESSSATTISAPKQEDAASVSKQLTSLIVESVRKQRSTIDTGPSVAVVYRQEFEPSFVIFDRAATDATARIACTTARSLSSQGYAATQDSLANLPLDMRAIDADIIILIRGRIDFQEQYRTNIVAGILKYWDTETIRTAQTPPATSTPPEGVQ